MEQDLLWEVADVEKAAASRRVWADYERAKLHVARARDELKATEKVLREAHRKVLALGREA